MHEFFYFISESLYGLVKPAATNFFPIDHIKKGIDVIWPSVLVIEIVGMLPDI